MIPFGPIPSRRLGHSLGINNLLPPKRCSYSCVYCQVGPTQWMRVQRRAFHPPERIAAEVAERVEELRRRDEPIDFLSFVPDGEPTLDLNLGRAIDLLRPLGIPVAVFTNGSLLDQPAVREALGRADLVSVKVDAARETAWRRVDRPDPALRLASILDGLRTFARGYNGALLTETMLVAGLNESDEELEATARLVAELQPWTAYIAVPTRPVAEPWAAPASEEAVARAYAIFRAELPSVECLTGFEPGAGGFGHSSDARCGLLDILAVHPMREVEVEQYLEQAPASRSVLEELVGEGLLKRVEQRGHVFYVLCHGSALRRRAAASA